MNAPIPSEFLDRYRGYDVDDDYWHRCIIDDLIEDLEAVGFYVDCGRGPHREPVVHWQLFVQGSGLSFDGYINGDKIVELLDTKGHADKFPSLRDYVASGGDVFFQTRTDRGTNMTGGFVGTYSHHDLIPWNGRDELSEALAELLDDGFEAEQRECEELLNDVFAGFADAAYRRLCEEYDYLTSDEHITEIVRSSYADELEEYLLEEAELEDAA
jgi:hypothetical protein